MNWTLATVGKPALGFAQTGTDLYLERIRRGGWPVRWEIIRDKGSAANADAMLQRTSGACRIVLDEKGRSFSSMKWASWIQERRDQGTRDFALIVGGAEGHTSETRQKADLILTLSEFTLQHELAALMAAEQLYRAQTILHGHPYHREG